MWWTNSQITLCKHKFAKVNYKIEFAIMLKYFTVYSFVLFFKCLPNYYHSLQLNYWTLWKKTKDISSLTFLWLLCSKSFFVLQRKRRSDKKWQVCCPLRFTSFISTCRSAVNNRTFALSNQVTFERLLLSTLLYCLNVRTEFNLCWSEASSCPQSCSACNDGLSPLHLSVFFLFF